MTFQTVLLTIHSWIRWLILLAAAAALVFHLIGLLQKKSEYDKPSQGSISAFSRLMDLNFAFGLIQLVAYWGVWSAAAGGFPLPQIEHMGTMLVATFVSHAPSIFWSEKPANVRYRNTLIAVIVAVLLIVGGIMSLAGSRWVFRGL